MRCRGTHKLFASCCRMRIWDTGAGSKWSAGTWMGWAQKVRMLNSSCPMIPKAMRPVVESDDARITSGSRRAMSLSRKTTPSTHHWHALLQLGSWRSKALRFRVSDICLSFSALNYLIVSDRSLGQSMCFFPDIVSKKKWAPHSMHPVFIRCS